MKIIKHNIVATQAEIVKVHVLVGDGEIEVRNVVYIVIPLTEDDYLYIERPASDYLDADESIQQLVQLLEGSTITVHITHDVRLVCKSKYSYTESL